MAPFIVVYYPPSICLERVKTATSYWLTAAGISIIIDAYFEIFVPVFLTKDESKYSAQAAMGCALITLLLGTFLIKNGISRKNHPQGSPDQESSSLRLEAANMDGYFFKAAGISMIIDTYYKIFIPVFVTNDLSKYSIPAAMGSAIISVSQGLFLIKIGIMRMNQLPASPIQESSSTRFQGAIVDIDLSEGAGMSIIVYALFRMNNLFRLEDASTISVPATAGCAVIALLIGAFLIRSADLKKDHLPESLKNPSSTSLGAHKGDVLITGGIHFIMDDYFLVLVPEFLKKEAYKTQYTLLFVVCFALFTLFIGIFFVVKGVRRNETPRAPPQCQGTAEPSVFQDTH